MSGRVRDRIAARGEPRVVCRAIGYQAVAAGVLLGHREGNVDAEEISVRRIHEKEDRLPESTRFAYHRGDQAGVRSRRFLCFVTASA